MIDSDFAKTQSEAAKILVEHQRPDLALSVIESTIVKLEAARDQVRSDEERKVVQGTLDAVLAEHGQLSRRFSSYAYSTRLMLKSLIVSTFVILTAFALSMIVVHTSSSVTSVVISKVDHLVDQKLAKVAEIGGDLTFKDERYLQVVAALKGDSTYFIHKMKMEESNASFFGALKWLEKARIVGLPKESYDQHRKRLAANCRDPKCLNVGGL